MLHLDNNKLTELPDGVFDSLASLTRLLLYANELETLPDGVFDKLTSLTSLYLSRNQLTSLPAGVFDSLTSLQGLRLDNNLLTTLPDNVFAKLTNLVNIRLERNPGAPFVPLAAALPDDGTVSTDGGTVTLDGSDSGGAWGTNVTYSWALTTPTSGVTVTFDDDTSAMPVVTIPALPVATELTFTLTVTGHGGTKNISTAAVRPHAADTVTVTPAIVIPL